jgi:hypothetical protein
MFLFVVSLQFVCSNTVPSLSMIFVGEIHREINLCFSMYHTGQLDVIYSILNNTKRNISIRGILQFWIKMQEFDIYNP